MSNGIDYSQYNDKKVVLVFTVAGQAEASEVEGVISVGNDQGVLFKPKGKTKLELIAAGDIIEARLLQDAPKALAAKVLKLVEFGSARNHLLERHGYTLGSLNKMTEEAAFILHEGIDHKVADLGHRHEDKAESAAAKAIEAAANQPEPALV